MRQSDQTVFLSNFLNLVQRRFWIMLALTVVIVGAAVGVSFLQTPQYQSSVEVLVGQDQGITETPNDVVGLQQLTQTLTEIANSRPVSEAAIEDQNLSMTVEDFGQNLTVQQVDTTQVIEITYTDPVPETARSVADSVGEAFSDEVAEITSSSNPITATVLSEAAVPDEPSSPQPLRNGILAMVLGVMLSIALAYLLDFFDDSWHSPEEAEAVTGVPTFGVIPVFASVKGKHLPMKNRRRKSVSAVEGSPTPAGVSDEFAEGWPVSAVLVSADGRIERANAKYLSTFGYEEGEVTGKEFVSFAAHPDDVEAHAAAHEALVSGEQDQYEIEKRCIAKDGTLIWFSCSVSVENISPESNRRAVAVLQNVTKQKHAEETYRISAESESVAEKRLGSVADNSSLMLVSISTDGQLLYSNERWDEFWSGSNFNVVSDLLEDQFMQESGMTEHIRQSLSDGQSRIIPEVRYVPSSNGRSPRWLSVAISPIHDKVGRVIEVLIMVRDSTESKQTQEALERSVAERQNAEKERKAIESRFRELMSLATDNPWSVASGNNNDKGRASE